MYNETFIARLRCFINNWKLFCCFFFFCHRRRCWARFKNARAAILTIVVAALNAQWSGGDIALAIRRVGSDGPTRRQFATSALNNPRWKEFGRPGRLSFKREIIETARHRCRSIRGNASAGKTRSRARLIKKQPRRCGARSVQPQLPGWNVCCVIGMVVLPFHWTRRGKERKKKIDNEETRCKVLTRASAIPLRVSYW